MKVKKCNWDVFESLNPCDKNPAEGETGGSGAMLRIPHFPISLVSIDSMLLALEEYFGKE